MKKSAIFLVTRPIQYINIYNIPGFNEIEEKFLIIEDSFANAKNLYTVNLKYEEWKKVYFIKGIYSCMKFIAKNRKCFDSFYTFSDCGLPMQSYLWRLLNIDIYVYEEGTATYKKYFNKNWNPKSLLLKVLNHNIYAGDYIGCYSKTKVIYVYNPQLFHLQKPHVKCRVENFSKPFFEHIMTCNRAKPYIYENLKKYNNRNVLLYITGWNYNKKILDYVELYKDYELILKPHPHLKRDINYDKLFADIINAEYLAEIIISVLIKISSDLIIVHSGSSAILQFIGEKGVKLVDLEDQNSNKWFNDLCNNALSIKRKE